MKKLLLSVLAVMAVVSATYVERSEAAVLQWRVDLRTCRPDLSYREAEVYNCHGPVVSPSVFNFPGAVSIAVTPSCNVPGFQWIVDVGNGEQLLVQFLMKYVSPTERGAFVSYPAKPVGGSSARHHIKIIDIWTAPASTDTNLRHIMPTEASDDKANHLLQRIQS